ncbi:hypothetical protein B0O80DRAFT_46017 [Mortierella sp. GBAus27b]|nr:hypothetical protein B0O80DRAFT_46017 [Mortierella sp. GBAus27b]
MDCRRKEGQERPFGWHLGQPGLSCERNMLYTGKTKAKNDATGFQVAVTSLVELTGLTPVKSMIPGFTIDSIRRLSEIAMVSVRSCLRSHYRNVQFSEHKADEESDIEFFFRQNEVERLYKDFPTASLFPCHYDKRKGSTQCTLVDEYEVYPLRHRRSKLGECESCDRSCHYRQGYPIQWSILDGRLQTRWAAEGLSDTG